MELHREQAAGHHPIKPHSVRGSLQELFVAANNSTAYLASDRQHHTRANADSAIRGGETAISEIVEGPSLAKSAHEQVREPHPFKLDPLRDDPDFHELYLQFSPDEVEMGLDSRCRQLQAQAERSPKGEQTECSPAMSQRNAMRDERLSRWGAAVMPMLERRQAALAKVAADESAYLQADDPVQPVAQESAFDWQKQDVETIDIIASSQFSDWSGGDAAGDVLLLARDLATGRAEPADMPVFLLPRTNRSGQTVYCARGGQRMVAALKLLGEVSLEADVGRAA